MRYIISDAAKSIEVEPHVLRYWEEELAVEIPRNEMGHRYYREEDIHLMRGVKLLKEKGFQLKSIRLLLSEIDKVTNMEERKLLELRDRLELAISKEELRQQREEELKGAKDKVVQLAERRELTHSEGEETLPQSVEQEQAGRVAEAGMGKQPEGKLLQFKVLMNEIVKEAVTETNRALTEELTESIAREMEYQLRRKEMLEEERYKRLDRTIREYQQGQKQIAATKETGKKRESKFFKKHKVRI